jgi:superfamily II DNA/RNA helicase
MSSKFFTNSSQRNLFDKFTGIIESMHNLHAFHAVVGYFRSSGYFKLQPYLKDVKEIKILVGINVDRMFAETQRRGLLFFGDDAKAKHEFLKWFIEDIRQAKYSEEVESGILQFVIDLIDGRIEVRAHNSKAIHAKFYLFLPESHNANSDGWVIMGSSNLTEAGLGIRQSPNYELNIALKDFDDVEFAKGEFAALWAESTPILPADIKNFKEKTHIDRRFTPFELYVKFLIEYFGKNIDYDPDTIGDLPTTYKKLSYQIDAVNQGFQMLLDHNGFFLADVVGLGKTVVAAMIAKRFLIANGTLNSKILVVFPPAVEKNWKDTFRQFGIDRHTKFITNGRLEQILDNTNSDYWPKEEYDLVLVDEAHRYRNHTSRMFDHLQRICKAPRSSEGQLPGNKKKVVLISATPLNNRPQDLYYQLLLFQDARRSTLTETNLQTFFGPLVREYRDIIGSQNPDMDRIRDIYELIREKVLTPITVRRTRKDLENYPKYFDDLKDQGIVFPDISEPRAIRYELEGELGELFARSMEVLTIDVEYFRYRAVACLNEEIRDELYPQAKLVSQSLAGIFRTLMVKRLESSFHAFKRSLNNIRNATARMIEMFAEDKVFIAPDFDVNSMMEEGMSIEEIEMFILERTLDEPNTRNRVFTADQFEPGLIEGLQKDMEHLEALNGLWAKVSEDPKLDQFFVELDREFLNSTINPTGKLVIFTESKDTADYLQQAVEAKLKNEVLNVSAANRRRLFETIRDNFDANYTGEQKDDYKIIITTDVLAEGVNLHRANVVINYDTPWNATRLMQRIGRVNRIGSVAGTIHSYNFYPSPQGDFIIQLYNKALVKLQSFHSAFGEDARIFTHEELVEQFELFEEGGEEEEDKRLFYLRFIREFKDSKPNEFKRIRQLPLKARTARSATAIGDNEISGQSVVFLRSPYKSEFYKVDPANSIEALTFLEAAGMFEAEPGEEPTDLPKSHFIQVRAALDAFEKDFFGSSGETVTTTDRADGRSNQAKKFLRDYRAFAQSDESKAAYTSLIELVDQGTFTILPNEIRKLKLRIDKEKIPYTHVENLVLRIAAKYITSNGQNGDEHTVSAELGANVEPQIILSETFVG